MAAGSAGGATQGFTEQISQVLASISQPTRRLRTHSYQNWGKIAEESVHKVSVAHRQHMTVLQQLSSESDRTYSKMGKSGADMIRALLLKFRPE